MTDTPPEALDALVKRLRAGYFSHDPLLTLGGVKHDPRCLEAADTIAAIRGREEAMRADNARLREALANAVGALDAAGEELSEFANILSREPREANLTYQSARDAQDALAFPLDAPASVDPVAEAARVLLRMGDLPQDAVSAAHRQIDWCRSDQKTNQPDHPSQTVGGSTSCATDIQDAWRAALRALAQETRHD